MNKILLIAISLFSAQLNAQDYKHYSILNFKAKLFLSENKTDSAIIVYNEMFANYGKLLPYDNLTAARIFASKKDTTMTLRILADMIKYGQSIDDILENKKNDSIFSFAKKSKLWDKLKTVKPEIDFSTLVMVNGWLEVDQFVRIKEEDDICNIVLQADSINNLNVMELINKQGYPGFKKLGIHSNDLIILIMHSSTNPSSEKYWESFYKPLLLNEACKGNISFSDYATLVDRYELAKHGSVVYGSLNSNKEYQPISNIKDVDKRRAEIGLPKLSIDAKIKSLTLPKDYIP